MALLQCSSIWTSSTPHHPRARFSHSFFHTWSLGTLFVLQFLMHNLFFNSPERIPFYVLLENTVGRLPGPPVQKEQIQCKQSS